MVETAKSDKLKFKAKLTDDGIWVWQITSNHSLLYRGLMLNYPTNYLTVSELRHLLETGKPPKHLILRVKR